MFKSKPSRAFGGRGGTVTVIEAKVHRSSARRALLSFYLTALAVWLLFALVMSDRWHPVAAFMAGGVVGVLSGAVVWSLVRAWPVIVRIWWWLPEILLAYGVGSGFTALAENFNLPIRIGVVALVVGVPAAIPASRRFVVAWAWCLIVRHRLRVCFTAFIVSNQQGSLPLIMWATPTPIGEQVLIYLRPGLALADLHGRLDKIATTCWADSATVERASSGNAAWVRLHIRRRTVLTADVSSPLSGMPVATSTAGSEDTVEITAVNLTDITATPPPPAAAPAPRQSRKPAAGSGPGDDVSDWI